jgi:hypothetical protein
MGLRPRNFLFWKHTNGIFVAVQIPAPTFGWTDVLTRAAAHAPRPATVAPALTGAVHPHALLAHATLAPAPLAGAGLARAALRLLFTCAVGGVQTVRRLKQEQLLHEPHSVFFAPAHQRNTDSKTPKAGAALARAALSLLRACAVGEYRQ